MKYDVYPALISSDDFSLFEFVSVGKNGSILKRIEFTATSVPNYFNLAFVDVNGGEIDDYSTSDNGDRNKVLATVAYTVDIYLNKYSDRFIYFRGSTDERTRLYRLAITVNFDELSEKFTIYAEFNNEVFPFEKNMKADGIIIKKRLKLAT